MEKAKTEQPYPPWLPNVLLSLTAFLLVLSAILGAGVYKLATRAIRLEDLSTTQRQYLIERASEIVPPVYQPFPLTGQLLFYHMVPNTRYVNVLGATFTTNDLGFRTIPTNPKPQGIKRIVVVGDSWTFGRSVQYDETFSYQLQKMLNRNGDKWQVYNLSVPGWNTTNEIAALRTFFSRLNPEVVVFCPTSNDIDDSLGVWNGRLVHYGFASGSGFRHSYEYQTRWINVFQSLQSEVDLLKRQGVPSLIYFLAEWQKLAPYYAKLSGLHARYTVVPTEYIQKRYRLRPEIDPGEHASPEGHELIASHLHNALLEQQLVTGLELLPIKHRVEFPGHAFDSADVQAELERGRQSFKRPDLIPLNDGFVGRKALFSVIAPPQARTVSIELELIDDLGLYPLTVEVGLECIEKISLTKVFDHFVAGPQVIEISKPRSLDVYPIIEVHVTADRVVVAKDGLIPISMKRPRLQIR